MRGPNTRRSRLNACQRAGAKRPRTAAASGGPPPPRRRDATACGWPRARKRRRRGPAAGRDGRRGIPGRDPGRSEGADEALDPFVVGLERVLAEDRLALGVVELQVDPVDAVVLALEVGLPDELTAQSRARGLRRLVLGALDGLVVG